MPYDQEQGYEGKGQGHCHRISEDLLQKTSLLDGRDAQQGAPARKHALRVKFFEISFAEFRRAYYGMPNMISGKSGPDGGRDVSYCKSTENPRYLGNRSICTRRAAVPSNRDIKDSQRSASFERVSSYYSMESATSDMLRTSIGSAATDING